MPTPTRCRRPGWAFSLATLAALSLTWPAFASPSPDEPATQPADPPATQPAPTDQREVAPDVIADLDRIAIAADELRTFTARIRYDNIVGLLDDEQRRFGELIYRTGPPAAFSLHFTRLLVDGIPHEQNQRWIFDGRWLVEQYDDKKQFLKQQVVAPDADPGTVDPLALGEGPFPLPLRADRRRLLQRFHVVRAPGSPDGRADTDAEADEDAPAPVKLRFLPRFPDALDADWLEVTWDPATLLPTRVETFAEASEHRRVFTILRGQANVDVDEAVFDTTPPGRDAGWMIEIRPWRPNSPAG